MHVQAVIDTGFSDELSVPVEIAVALGLELCGTRKFMLGDGSVRKELTFSARVRWLNEERDVEILLTESEEALLGRMLMDDCRLTIDFAKGTVDLRKSSRKPLRSGR